MANHMQAISNVFRQVRKIVALPLNFKQHEKGRLYLPSIRCGKNIRMPRLRSLAPGFHFFYRLVKQVAVNVNRNGPGSVFAL